VATYLDRILASHRAAAEADHRDVDLLEREAAALPPARHFAEALVRPNRLGVIAEVKRRSPSKPTLALSLNPAALAVAYEQGGASALSVLTDAEFFGGSPDDLGAAREASSLPVLRKDFTVCRTDVLDARLMGADAVLLIAAALGADELRDLLALSAGIGLDALVEVHDESEAEVAVCAGAKIIGVNQRDLRSFEVDTDRAVRVAASLPPGCVRVAESGISGPDDARRLADAGFDAVLVGETLVTSSDPKATVSSLRARKRCVAERDATVGG
jgi:indole-3-glycerol phosphate synthase